MQTTVKKYLTNQSKSYKNNVWKYYYVCNSFLWHFHWFLASFGHLFGKLFWAWDLSWFHRGRSGRRLGPFWGPEMLTWRTVGLTFCRFSNSFPFLGSLDTYIFSLFELIYLLFGVQLLIEMLCLTQPPSLSSPNGLGRRREALTIIILEAADFLNNLNT